jgi:hypothetical protein
MTALNLADGSALRLEEAPQCLHLEPAFDGARIAVEVRPWTQNPQQDQISVLVTATLLAGRSHNPGEMRTLAALRSDGLVYNHASPTRLTLSGYTSAQALREVEEERAGGELWLVLADLKATGLQGTPAKFFESIGTNLAIKVLAGQWAAELEKVTDASYVEILIPVTGDPEMSIGAGRVRKARALIRGGEFNAAAAELRQALEPVRAYYKTLDANSAAVPKNPKQRTENERFAMYVQGLYSWLTSYVHDDEESIKGCQMDRAAANQALGAVAGLLHRLSYDHTTASV